MPKNQETVHYVACISPDDELGRNRSPSMAADIAITGYYAMIDAAWSEIADCFDALDLFDICAALQGSYVDTALIEGLALEMADYYEALEEDERENADPSTVTRRQLMVHEIGQLTLVQKHALVAAARAQYANRRAAIVAAEQSLCFNPHPARRPGATGTPDSLAVTA